MQPIIKRFNDTDRERNIWWLVIGTCGLSSLGWITNTQNPDNTLLLTLFFVILFATVYSFAFFATNTLRRSLLISAGVLGFFLLRLLGLREPFYIVLFIACLISLELSTQRR